MAVCLSSGCATGRYYDLPAFASGSVFVVDEGARKQKLLSLLPDRLDKSELSRIDIRTPDKLQQVAIASGRGVEKLREALGTLAELPASLLGGIFIAADARARGAEMDLIFFLPGDQRVPVSTRYEPDRVLVIEQGAPLRPDFGAPRITIGASDLKARYGIAPSEHGQADWRAEHYAVLDEALGLLSGDERAFLSRVPIAREHMATGGSLKNPQVVRARYVRRGGQARIEIYDSVLSEDDTLFCGTVDRPLPHSVRIILHEIGHALADAANTTALGHLGADLESLHQRSDPIFERARSRGQNTEDGIAVSQEEYAAVMARLERLGDSQERLESLGEEGPVLSAYRRARSPGKGPTPYGATSLDESFADAFALYRADPEALRRIDPRSYDWFEKGGHLSALAVAPVPSASSDP